MNKKQWVAIIVFLIPPSVVFAITSLSYRSLEYSENDVLLALKAMEYSLLTWICLIFISISFICRLLEEEEDVYCLKDGKMVKQVEYIHRR